MASRSNLKLFWHVERSHGGDGDYWLVVRAEKLGEFSGGSSVRIPTPQEITRRDLCSAVVYLAQKFVVKKADREVFRHSINLHVLLG